MQQWINKYTIFIVRTTMHKHALVYTTTTNSPTRLNRSHSRPHAKTSEGNKNVSANKHKSQGLA